MNALILCVGLMLAAPPKVDFLYPAGCQAGGKTLILASGTIDGAPRGWANHPGIHIKPTKSSTQFEVSVDAAVPPGLYYVRFINADGASNLRPFFVSGLPEFQEKEPNDSVERAMKVSGSSVVNGRLEKAGDVDTVLFSLKKGETLVAAVEAFRTLKSPMDGILQIVDPKGGFVLAQNDDHRDFDPQATYTAEEDGPVAVRIFAFPAVPNSSINFAGKETFVYRLTLTTGPAFDFVWPSAIGPSEKSKVELIGFNQTDATRFVSINPTPGDDFVFPFGAYLRAERHPVLVAADSGAHPLPLPATIVGKSATGKAIYEFEAGKGEKITFQMESRSMGFGSDASLVVRSPAGTIVGQSTPKLSDTSVVVTGGAKGKYQLTFQSELPFRLRCLSAVPDFDVTTPADRVMAVEGKPFEVPVTIDRRGGFEEPITWKLIGFDSSIEAVPSKDGKTITLRFAPPKSGAFQIQATAKDRVRFVRANIAELGIQTKDLWGSVRK